MMEVVVVLVVMVVAVVVVVVRTLMKTHPVDTRSPYAVSLPAPSASLPTTFTPSLPFPSLHTCSSTITWPPPCLAHPTFRMTSYMKR